MTTRELLHAIVDSLPEYELKRAENMLTALNQPAASLSSVLASAPLDDEPDDDDFDGGLTAARHQAQSGQTISHEELLRRLGLDK
ncbi:MAG: hypothetical protein QOC81_4193 [Thermoanaerobaculia bacterium]|jgi:hypothetical protein|nr:hypothetical protein [Thermoanaerobaculia bacterium]